MIVSWKLETRKSLCENKLLSSSNSKLDRWIMFLMLHRFMEIINDLESSHRLIALNNFSIPGDKSGEPQKDILDEMFSKYSATLPPSVRKNAPPCSFCFQDEEDGSG
jgi:hypothetical protein